MSWDGKAIDWNTEFGRRPIEEVYNDTLLDYKDRAREDFSNELGYEPPLEHSMVAEYFYRTSLNDYKNNEITKEQLIRGLKSRAKTVNSMVKNEVPELKKQALKYEKKLSSNS